MERNEEHNSLTMYTAASALTCSRPVLRLREWRGIANDPKGLFSSVGPLVTRRRLLVRHHHRIAPYSRHAEDYKTLNGDYPASTQPILV